MAPFVIHRQRLSGSNWRPAMFPIGFYLGPYPIYSYGLFVILGAVVLFTLAFAQARGAGRRQDHMVYLDPTPAVAGKWPGAAAGVYLSAADRDRLSRLYWRHPDIYVRLVRDLSRFMPCFNTGD
jgi:hypothetical protein